MMESTSKRLKLWTLVAVALGALAAVPARAQTTSTTTAPATQAVTESNALSKLIAQYSQWAGSKENAKSLVQGLNTGSTVTLSSGAGTSGGTTNTFTPATSKLGVGEVGIALSLAKASLAQQGITNPTPAQLSAALNGGMVTSSTSSTSLVGVLAQRESGSGWGQIAQSLGVKLGSVMSASKTDKSSAGKESTSSQTGAKDKSERNKGNDDANNGSGHASARASQGGGNSGGGGGGGGNSGGGGGGKK
jgi:hypothetical protein